jgi:hypothetical protein
MIKFLLLPIILVGCTAPVTDPPAHACSPRLDGEPTYCPEPDAVCLSLDCPKLLPREEMRGEIDVYDPNHWQQMQYFWLRNARRNEIEKNATTPTDAINNALLEFNNGSNDTTESEELLQLPSDIHNQGT